MPVVKCVPLHTSSLRDPLGSSRPKGTLDPPRPPSRLPRFWWVTSGPWRRVRHHHEVQRSDTDTDEGTVTGTVEDPEPPSPSSLTGSPGHKETKSFLTEDGCVNHFYIFIPSLILLLSPIVNDTSILFFLSWPCLLTTPNVVLKLNCSELRLCHFTILDNTPTKNHKRERRPTNFILI